MEQRIKERFNHSILQETLNRFDIAPDKIRLLDGFESFIYEFKQNGGSYILRISHSLRRSVQLICAEVDWMNFLATGGAGVSPAIHSKAGELVEIIEDGCGGNFLAAAFQKAQGEPPWKIVWTPQLYEIYGSTLGRMHALTKNYQPSDPTWLRPQWDDAIIQDVDRNLPPSEALALERYQSYFEQVEQLPKDRNSYGLIHFDAHEGNFLIDSAGRITLFDFDDCCYNWFIYDIAIVLFYKAMGHPDIPAFTEEFMTHFLRGYSRENHLDPKWLKEIPKFLKLREIDLYAVIHRSFDVENLEDPWCIRYMKDRKRMIEDDVPYINFNFQSLVHLLR